MKNIKSFHLFENIDNSIDFPTKEEISDIMSNYLDDFNKNIENFGSGYMCFFKGYSLYSNDSNNISTISDSKSFRRIYFTEINKGHNPLSHMSAEPYISKMHHKEIRKLIYNNEVKAYPFIYFRFGRMSDLNAFIEYEIEYYNADEPVAESEVKERPEWDSFAESLKSLYHETGFRPISDFDIEDYVDEKTADVITLISFNGFFIECDDDEYEKIYWALNPKNSEICKKIYKIFQI